MFVSIQELQQREVPLSLDFKPGEFDFLDESLRQEDVIRVHGAVRLRESTGELQVKAALRGLLSFPCDRCLARVQWPIALDLDLTYLPADASPQEDERAITADEAEIGFYDQDGIALDDVWREQVLLSLPMRRVCQPHCQEALLPERAQGELTDSRWSALAAFRPGPAPSTEGDSGSTPKR